MAAPTAGTAGRAETCGWSRRPASRRCSVSRTTRTDARVTARTAGGKQKRGANGADLEVKVPVGTTVHRLDGSPVADLSAPGDRALVARGGRGGRGNARFLSNRRRAPAFAEQAEVGEELWMNLELRLLADVALVGFPNVGKSTFISAVSAARPKIADYPVHDPRAASRASS